MSDQAEKVCVTGGSGCIGSWLVRLLLERGYAVHATVQNLKDEAETKHLQALTGVETRLRLFQIDLLDYESLVSAISGCSGVFHLASPCIVDQVHDPEKELLDPAIKGTTNVLRAAKKVGVTRVVVTSSISALSIWVGDGFLFSHLGRLAGIGMRKRERENPCGVCGHYHKYEEGEVCGICGHRMVAASERTSVHFSAFPSEILPQFLYLGSYDNASRSELLKAQGISRVLNTVPACQNLYKNSFTYYCLQDDKSLPFDEANQFLEQCERDKARVLVHCMSGKSRSPAIVIAYLMKSKGWRLGQSYQWVKERRPSVDLTEAVYQQLQEYEKRLLGSMDGPSPSIPDFPSLNAQPFTFGSPSTGDHVPVPVFNNISATTIFSRPDSEVPPQEFTFGAGQSQNNTTSDDPNSSSDVQMDSS